MLSALALLLSMSGGTPAPTAAPVSAPNDLIAGWVRATSSDRARINIWLNRDDVYNRGDRARVYFKSDRDAYVTVVRIDTDGRLRVLFPIDPWEDNFARGGKTFEVLGRDRDEAFRIDDYPGVGYIFAIASQDPFTYDDIIRGDHWDYHTISDGRVRGDPYVVLGDLAEKIAREDDYDYDVSEYYVEKHYDYPRFVCYDCHTYTSWRAWDPYGSYCSRFRIVVYDDWYYYPYRRYGGGGVIIRPYRPGPRYVFKDSDPRNDYITRVAERPRGGNDDRRSPMERDRSSADVGGRGAIPAPASPRRRTSDAPNSGTSSGEPRRSPETRQPSNDGRPAPSGTGGSSEPRRRPTDDRSSDAGNTREVPSTDGGDSPRRRPSEDRGRDAGNTREAPSSDDGAEPRRRPSDDRPVQNGRPETQQQPDRGGTSRQPERREPARTAPPPDRPRAEPRPSSPPRSTGEPRLTRRRP